MFNRIRLGIMLLLFIGVEGLNGQDKGLPLSYEESLLLLQKNNKSIRIAEKEVDIARAEHAKLNSFWYPSINAAGTYMHFSNKIEVKEPLSQLTNPVKDFVHGILPDDQIISMILDKIGSYTLSFPLAPQDVTTIDANIVWPIFTGGKRINATKIGKSMIDLARYNQKEVSALTQVALVDAYFALRLGKRVVSVRREAYEALSKQYRNALKLEENGMINKAEKLVVEVAMKEAFREYEAAQKSYNVAQQAFKSLVCISSSDLIMPTSSLFIVDSLPSPAYFKSIMGGSNYLVNQLQVQERMAKYQENIGKSGYMPNIALIGKQTLYAHGLEKNLIPRTMIGVGFTWNIFDGLNREKNIRQARLTAQSLSLGREKAISEIEVGIDQFYSQLQVALDDVQALNSTIALSQELVKMRQKAFAEGMATSTEVVDAQVMLSQVKIAYLLAYYQFDSSLINLLSLCGIPDSFIQYKRSGKTEDFLFE